MANLRKRNRKNNANGNFNDLPEELLELIFECIWRPRKNIILGATMDFIRISAVCKKWQRVSSRVNKQSGIVGPLIFVSPAYREKSRLARLYDFSSNKTQKLQVPRTLGYRWFINSWNEWLVTSEIRCLNSYYHVHFYNMFSGAYIQLPHSSSLYPSCVKKVTASCPPLDPNCVVMAITYDTFKLSFCKIGDIIWEILETELNLEQYDDLLYYKNEFYVVTNHGNLFACDLKCAKLRTVARLDLVYAEVGHNYLVEISGDLFLIIRRRGDMIDGVLQFAVYKMDFSQCEWQEVDSLGDGNSIFVGQNMSICISANDLNIQNDCIYFNDNYGIKQMHGTCDTIGLIDMKTKLIEPTFPPSPLWKNSNYLYWITKV